jgi:hypothetical protein
MPGGRTLVAAPPLDFIHEDLPAGPLPLLRESDRHDPAVNAGGVRAASPTGSSAANAGGRARSSGRAATTRQRSDRGCCGHSGSCREPPAWLSGVDLASLPLDAYSGHGSAMAAFTR